MSEKQQSHEGRRLRRAGAMWKPKPGGRSLGSGNFSVNGLRQRFVMLRNERKARDTDPDYLLMSSSEPETDTYVQDHHAAPARTDGRAPDDDPF